MDAKMWLGVVFSADPGTAKDVATLPGRGYGLFRPGIAGMAGTAAIINDRLLFPACLLASFHKNSAIGLTEDHGTRRP